MNNFPDGYKYYKAVYGWFISQALWLRITILLLIISLCILGPVGIFIAVLIIGGVWLFGHKIPNTSFYAKNIDPKSKKKFIVKYLTGIPNFSMPIDTCSLIVEDDSVCINAGLKRVSRLSYSSIVSISADTKTQITRTASMFKGAAGLVLAGPLGAMIGMGMGSKHDDSQSFISLIYKDELGEENLLLFQQKEGLFSHMSNAYEIATILKEARKTYLLNHSLNHVEEKEHKILEPHRDNLDQLEKLAELKDKGIVTNEEFEAKKKQLLDI